MEALEEELSKIAGMDGLKSQLRMLFKGLLVDRKRLTLNLQIGPRTPLRMAFLENPGTGKTMVAQVLAELLPKVGIGWGKRITEVRRIHLVSKEYGMTRQKTTEKIRESRGGILFVDEPYSLMRDSDGEEALKSILDNMDEEKFDLVVIFAGNSEKMKSFLSENEAISRCVSHTFIFDDYSCEDLAKMVYVKMCKDKYSPFYGYKLQPTCSVEAVAAMIERETTEKLRKKMNGRLVDQMLLKAKEKLDSRMDVQCEDRDSLLTITSQDLQAGPTFVKTPKRSNLRDQIAWLDGGWQKCLCPIFSFQFSVLFFNLWSMSQFQ